MLAAMLLIGAWISGRIEDLVVANTASAGALYLESIVSPLSQELAAQDRLSEPATRALDEVFASTGIGERIVSFKIWKPGGLVAHASNPALIGRYFASKPELQAAWAGDVTGSFDHLDDEENATEAALGLPLLEVYSPIHEVWSGKIIAVAEFYEVATDLNQDLADARRQSWLLVSGVFLASGLMLLGIVRAGGRTIARQKALLEAQIAESRSIADQNAELRLRAIGASARATAQTERSLRRISADLHDGPAQYVALAAMRLDSIVAPNLEGRQEAAILREALQTALAEIRAISRGLSLPELDHLSLAEVAHRAVDVHLRPAGRPVALTYSGPEDPEVDDSARIGLYRFLQEALSNAARHATGADVRVRIDVIPGRLTASVADDGPGFDPLAPRHGVNQGWPGSCRARDRAESIGGEVRVETSPRHRHDAHPHSASWEGRYAAMTIRTVLADDHPIFREGLVRTLEESGVFAVVGSAATADEAVALVEYHTPDLALLDISMPGGGIDAARRIRAASPPTRIAMLTVSEADQDVAGALRAGAIGYVLKGVSARELTGILASVARGEAHVSPALAARILRELQAPPSKPEREPIDTLTQREEDILRRVATGMSNREVAEALAIQEKTVKHYMTSILEKLHVRNRVEAALLARDAWRG